MDMLLLFRSAAALSVVLALLASALWLVRRFDVRIPGRAGGGRDVGVRLVERLSLDAKRSIVLVKKGEHEHLLLLSPEGHMELVPDGKAHEPALAIDLAQCRRLASASSVPMPPPPLPSPLPFMPSRRRRPLHGPVPAGAQ